ncbi:MAG: acylphosphatase [Phycisphaeraceae bacterium]|nr:acylphosphatase [Phycisphaeraceae bacterium]
MIRYTVYFEGHVQGVGFRYTAVNIALRYAVAGYVRNLPDRRVLLVAEGQKQQLDGLVAAILDHMGDHVRRHTIDEGAASGEFGPAAPGRLAVRH